MTKLIKSFSGVVVVRISVAAAQAAFTAVLIAKLGLTEAGRIAGTLASAELAAVIGQLGAPIVTARESKLRASPRLDAGVVAVPMTTSLAVGLVFGYAVDAAVPVGLGAMAITGSQTVGGYLRGTDRPAIGALLHPLVALLIALSLLILDVGNVIANYFTGAALSLAGVLALRAVQPTAKLTGAHIHRFAKNWKAGSAVWANQLMVWGLPFGLASFELFELAATISLATRLLRPLNILQFALNHTIGPELAGEADVSLEVKQRLLATRTSRLLQLAVVPYAVVGYFVVRAVADGWILNRLVPDLVATWALLLVGVAINVASGPTGQILLMRGRFHEAQNSAWVGLAVGVAVLALPGPAAMKVPLAASAAIGAQNALAARHVWRGYRWHALPSLQAPTGAIR